MSRRKENRNTFTLLRENLAPQLIFSKLVFLFKYMKSVNDATSSYKFIRMLNARLSIIMRFREIACNLTRDVLIK